MEIALPRKIKLYSRANFNPLAAEARESAVPARDKPIPHSQLVKETLANCVSCQKKNAPYKCTKCSEPYCSVQCYRDHNKQECSEEFYKSAAEEYMRHKRSGAKEKVRTAKQLLEHQKALQSGQEGLDSSEEEAGDSESTDGQKSGIPSEKTAKKGGSVGRPGTETDQPVWLEESQALALLEKLQAGTLEVGDLSHQEQLMFERFLKDEAGRAVEECTPVWEVDDGLLSFKIKAVSDDSHSNLPTEVVPESTVGKPSVGVQSAPDTAPKKVSLAELWAEEELFDPADPNRDADSGGLRRSRLQLHQTVSELPDIGLLSRLPRDKLVGLSYNLVNGVAATAAVYRRHNGDVVENSAEVCRWLWELAPCLRNDWRQYYSDAQEAFRYDLLLKYVGVNNKILLERVAQDAATILKHPFKVCEVLYLAYDCFARELDKVEAKFKISEGSIAEKNTSQKTPAIPKHLAQSRVELNCTLQKLLLMITQARGLSEEDLSKLQESVQGIWNKLSSEGNEEGLTQLKLPK